MPTETGWYSGDDGLVRKRTCRSCNKQMTGGFFTGEIEECSHCQDKREQEEYEAEKEAQYEREQGDDW